MVEDRPKDKNKTLRRQTGVRKTGLDQNYEMGICQAGLVEQKAWYPYYGYHAFLFKELLLSKSWGRKLY